MSRFTGVMAGAFDTYIRDNPVVIRDLRTRMRGLGAFGLLIGYLLLVSIVMCIIFYVEAGGWAAPVRITATNRIGSTMFVGLAWTQTIILLLVIPGVISAAVSKEYEKKTIEMVALSRLNSFLFVFGKLVSALLYCLVLVISTLPLAGICLMFGGISPEEIAVTYLLTIVFCFMMCSVGLYLSTVIGKTTGAGLLFYAFNWFYVTHTSYALMFMGLGGYSAKTWSMLMLPSFAASAGMESATICGVPIPIAIITVVVQVLCGVVLLYASAARVKHWRTERAGVLRVLLTITCVLFAVLTLGDASITSSMGSIPSKSMPLFPLTVLGVLVILASVIATGPIRKPFEQSMLSYLFTVRNLLKPDMSGALTFVTLISLLTYLAAAVAFSVNMGARITGAYWAVIAEQLVLVMSVVWLAASTGVLFSALFRSRVVAVIMSQVVIAAATAIYFAQYAYRIYNVGYPYGVRTPTPLVWPDHPGIIITTCICLVLSIGCLALTDVALKRCGGVAE